MNNVKKKFSNTEKDYKNIYKHKNRKFKEVFIMINEKKIATNILIQTTNGKFNTIHKNNCTSHCKYKGYLNIF